MSAIRNDFHSFEQIYSSKPLNSVQYDQHYTAHQVYIKQIVLASITRWTIQSDPKSSSKSDERKSSLLCVL